MAVALPDSVMTEPLLNGRMLTAAGATLESTAISSPSCPFVTATEASSTEWSASRSESVRELASETGLEDPSVKVATPPQSSLSKLSLMSVMLMDPVRRLLEKILSETCSWMLLMVPGEGSGTRLR